MTKDKQPAATPVVQAEAARRGIDLSTITPTGAGGRIRIEDVQAAAQQVPRRLPSTAAGRAPVTTTSLIDPGRTVTLDVFAANPLAEDVRQVAFRTPRSEPPKLFNGGRSDLPAFTASGVDPKVLLQLPFTMRHYAAACASAAEVYDLVENGSPWTGDRLAHPGLDEAILRVNAWHQSRADKSGQPRV